MPFSKHFLLAAVPMAILLCCSAYGGDLGTIGPTYKIREPDMLEWIEKRIAEKVKSGEVKKLQEEQAANIKKKLFNPEPLKSVSKASQNRTLYFDPTMTVEQNVMGERGQILVPAGTRINPLDKVGLSRPLVFFDARDPDQVAFAKKFIDARSGSPMPILVGGSYFDLMKSWKTPVYFDQQSALIRRFGIRYVPALVYQEGKRLRIDEISL